MSRPTTAEVDGVAMDLLAALLSGRTLWAHETRIAHQLVAESDAVRMSAALTKADLVVGGRPVPPPQDPGEGPEGA